MLADILTTIITIKIAADAVLTRLVHVIIGGCWRLHNHATAVHVMRPAWLPTSRTACMQLQFDYYCAF
jgi:hypothetical protein